MNCSMLSLLFILHYTDNNNSSQNFPFLYHRYLNSKHATPRHISPPRRDYEEEGSQNDAYDSLEDRLAHEHRYSTIERPAITLSTVSSSLPNKMKFNDEQYQPDGGHVNHSLDLEAYTNAYSVRKDSDLYLHVF